MQNSWNKYGEDNFEFYILEECDIEPLKKEDCTLFIKGNIQYLGKFMFPVLSHT